MKNLYKKLNDLLLTSYKKDNRIDLITFYNEEVRTNAPEKDKIYILKIINDRLQDFILIGR